jgi:tripartite-type tricarboxylate transporter receptor subunit TctC
VIPRSLGLCLGLLVAADPAAAQSIADFYKGKTLTIVVTTAAGSSNDIYARAITAHLAKHIPGNPSIVVKNVVGAGGLAGVNQLAQDAASQDGLTIGSTLPTVPFEPFYGNAEARFDALKVNWLGTPTIDSAVLMTWNSVPVDSVADAKSRGLILGATGAVSTPAFYARVLKGLFDIPIKLVAGYKSQPEAMLALERGEIEGYPSSFWSTMKATKADWIAEKKVKFLMQYGSAPHPDLKGIPFADDLLTDADKKLLMKIAVAPLVVARPMFAPPGVSVERVAVLQKAMSDTFADPEFRADCKKQNLECNVPNTGAQSTAVIREVYAVTPAIQKRFQEISALDLSR